jgi:hypothetical protein
MGDTRAYITFTTGDADAVRVLTKVSGRIRSSGTGNIPSRNPR